MPNWRRLVWLLSLLGTNAFVFAVQSQPTSQNSRPRALLESVRARSRLATGRLDLTITEWRVIRDTPSRRTTFQTIQWGEDTEIRVDNGDENGVVTLTPNGDPAVTIGMLPKMLYFDGQSRFERADFGLDIIRMFRCEAGEREDFRGLGMCHGEPRREIDDLIWHDRTPNAAIPQYSETRDGDLDVVAVTVGSRKTTYWIDAHRGWSVVRVRDESGANWSETRSALKQFDGVWYPALVVSSYSNFKDGAEPAREIRVENAEFNRPEFKRHLTVEDIGIEPGMMVTEIDPAKPQSRGRWSGSKVVSSSEFAKMANRGEVTESPAYVAAFMKYATKVSTVPSTPAEVEAFKAAQNANPVESSKPTSSAPASAQIKLDKWAEYVESFIAQYALDDDQAQKARLVLLECRARADRYINSIRNRLESTSAADRDSEHIQNLNAGATTEGGDKAATLFKPLDDIFELRLKPRLELIPTRAQRAAAKTTTFPTRSEKQP